MIHFAFCLQVIILNSLIDSGDLGGVSELLSQNVALNPKEGIILDIRDIPLFNAVHRGDCRMVELLTKEGADPNIRGKSTDGKTTEHLQPLILAARRVVSDRSYGVFEKLLQCGANPFAKTTMPCKGRMLRRGRIVKYLDDIVPLGDWMLRKILLENGTDPDKRDREGYTLLYKGCRALDKQLVHLLLQFNADLEIPCCVGARVTKYANTAPFEFMRMACFNLVTRPEVDGHRALKAIHIAQSLAMAGAAVYKDTVTGKSVATLYEDWACMENAVQQSIWTFTEEEMQEAVDCINVIKYKLTHAATLKYICGYKIRSILRPPDFNKKLTKLSQEFRLPPRLIDDYVAMKYTFPL